MKKRQIIKAVAAATLLVLLAAMAVFWSLRPDLKDTSLITEVGYLRDAEGLDFAEIRSLPFAKAENHFNAGYDTATHWFRLHVRMPDRRQPVVIGVFPTFLDHVTLFASDDGKEWSHQQTGDSVTSEVRSWNGASLGFVVHPASDENVYYLRLRSKSTAQVFLSARPLANELVHESSRMALHAVLFSMMGLAVIVAFIQTLYRATAVNALLMLSSLSYLVYSILLLGYAVIAHPAWDVRHVSVMADVLFFVAAASSIAFHRQFLSRMRPWRTSLWFADVLTLACLLALIAYVAGFETEAFKANSIFVLASVAALFAMACSIRDSGDPPLHVVRLIYTVFAFFSVGWMTVNLGLTPVTEFHRYSAEVHGLLNVLLVLTLVLSRWWSMERKHDAKKARLRDAALRNAASARASELQDKLLNMLVHEVRNHLAIIRMSVETALTAKDRDDAAKVVAMLERTISDCLRLAWLERGEWQPRAGRADLITVVLESLAEAGEDDRIEVSMPDDMQPVLSDDGTMLRTALGHLLAEVACRSRPDAIIHVSVERDSAAPDERWRIGIRADGGPERPISFDPYAQLEKDGRIAASRSSLALAVAQGIVNVMNGRLTLGYSRRRIECILQLPASSTSA